MCTNPLIIVYDKGGTVEVYGECFKLIGLFCLLLHVSIIFLNLQPPNVNKNTRSGLARHVMGTIFLVFLPARASEQGHIIGSISVYKKKL